MNEIAVDPTRTLRSAEFRRAREASWRELEALVDRLERKGLGAASPQELERLPLLYRATLSSLAVARTNALDRNLLAYLENLSLRGYLAVYRARAPLLATVAGFLARDFPRAVRAAAPALLLSFVVFALGCVIGWALVHADPAWFDALTPRGLSQGRGMQWTREQLLHDELFQPWRDVVDSLVVFANALFRHNALVGLLAFGLGAAGGVPTLLLLAYQGLILGAFYELHATRDLAVDFLGWVSIHGVTEIGAILLSGAAGLMVAKAILRPGPYTHLDNLVIAGRQAAQVMAGAALMFLLAGLIEGVLRQAIASTPWRFVFAGASAAMWGLYFWLAGRK